MSDEKQRDGSTKQRSGDGNRSGDHRSGEHGDDTPDFEGHRAGDLQRSGDNRAGDLEPGRSGDQRNIDL